MHSFQTTCKYGNACFKTVSAGDDVAVPYYVYGCATKCMYQGCMQIPLGIECCCEGELCNAATSIGGFKGFILGSVGALVLLRAIY
jgi:hypothetical protein